MNKSYINTKSNISSKSALDRRRNRMTDAKLKSLRESQKPEDINSNLRVLTTSRNANQSHY